MLLPTTVHPWHSPGQIGEVDIVFSFGQERCDQVMFWGASKHHAVTPQHNVVTARRCGQGVMVRACGKSTSTWSEHGMSQSTASTSKHPPFFFFFTLVTGPRKFGALS